MAMKTPHSLYTQIHQQKCSTCTHAKTQKNHLERTPSMWWEWQGYDREGFKGEGPVTTHTALNGGAVESMEEGLDNGLVPPSDFLHHLICSNIIWKVVVILLLHGRLLSSDLKEQRFANKREIASSTENNRKTGRKWWDTEYEELLLTLLRSSCTQSMSLIRNSWESCWS